ncbi:tyrosine-type recombinase/integrase [Bacillus dakarensis]|uniref:tyrosine-type recombinase/integrase n=1 Tax=Robertmurraya dakarensis TaxID=1926278 RepID=UPI0009819E3F|nr:tyrosine-type recombinase/integrase [Bacillus dakarensis]
MDEIIEEYRGWLKVQGKSVATIQTYVQNLKKFFKFIMDHSQVQVSFPLQRVYVIRYKEWLLQQKKQYSTINIQLLSILSFNSFCIHNGYMKEWVVYRKQDCLKDLREKQVNVLTEEEITRILFYMKSDNRFRLRNECIVLVLLYTGVRVTECINIKLDHINWVYGELTVVGKGKRIRSIPLRTDVLEILKDYVRKDRIDHPHASSPYLFLSQRSPQLSRDAVCEILKGLGRKVNVHLYPHLFRHTFCTRLLKKGADIELVSKLAGHSSVQTTIHYYISYSDDDKRNALNLL